MATIDMADYAGAGLHQTVHGTRFPFAYHEVEIDLTVAATEKGSALAANDVIQAIDVPAGSVILAAGLQVTTVNAGSTVLTLDLGVTDIDADNFVDGFDFVAAVDNEYAQAPAAFQPIIVGDTADTLDVFVASLTTTNTAGVLRVWAILGDITAVKKPGLTALKS